MSVYSNNNIFQKLDLSTLKHFFLVATYGGFSKASRATGISQPALSLGLQKLEKGLGVTLIERNERQFELTRPGLALFGFCQQLEVKLETTINSFSTNSVNIRRIIKIGTALPIGFAPFLSYCQKNLASTDPAELELVTDSATVLLQQVALGRLDAALVLDNVYEPELSFTRIWKDQVVFIVKNLVKNTNADYSDQQPRSQSHTNESWKKALEDICLITYPRDTSMRSVTDKICLEEGLKFRSVYSVNTLDALKLFVQSGLGGAFVLRSLVQQELAESSLHEFMPASTFQSLSIMLVTRQGEHGDSIIQEFKNAIKTS